MSLHLTSPDLIRILGPVPAIGHNPAPPAEASPSLLGTFKDHLRHLLDGVGNKGEMVDGEAACRWAAWHGDEPRRDRRGW